MRSRPRFLFEGEEVILNTRLHLRALLKPITVGAALVALAAAARWLYPGSPLDGLQIPEALLSLLLPERLGVRNFVRPDLWPLAAGGVLVLYALYLLTRIVRWRRHRVVVTTHRLIETSGVFGRRVSSVALANISDHRFRRSIPGRLFGYGQVVVSAAGRRHSIGPLPRRRRVDEAIAAALTPSSPVHSDKRVNRPSTRKYTARPEPVRPAQGTRRAAPLQSVGKREAATPLSAQRVFDGRYVLVSRIAAGGMGTVYEGMDNRLRRSVAIKLLNEGLAGDALFIERFRREARAVASLSHPNIASLFDYGEDNDTPYIVMELLPGRDLARVLQQEGPLSPGRASETARRVLEALQHGHDAGVVHRDVKPANVIVDDLGGVKVTDFGIARAVGDERMTATGIALGSAPYMSPEQVRGRGIGPRSDIYSAGILLYEMLCGAPPFDGASLLDVAERRAAGGVPLPSLSNSAVPPALDQVVAKATARHPEDRWASARDVAAALSALDGMGSFRSRRPRRRPRPPEEIDTPPLFR